MIFFEKSGPDTLENIDRLEQHFFSAERLSVYVLNKSKYTCSSLTVYTVKWCFFPWLKGIT